MLASAVRAYLNGYGATPGPAYIDRDQQRRRLQGALDAQAAGSRSRRSSMPRTSRRLAGRAAAPASIRHHGVVRRARGGLQVQGVELTTLDGMTSAGWGTTWWPCLVAGIRRCTCPASGRAPYRWSKRSPPSWARRVGPSVQRGSRSGRVRSRGIIADGVRADRCRSSGRFPGRRARSRRRLRRAPGGAHAAAVVGPRRRGPRRSSASRTT